MKHLTDDQLSALLDGALPAAELAACESHLAGCDACRARLAEAGALDASLGASLEHDPGEAYFESFADRVAARIAAGGAGAGAADAPRPEAAPSRWRWLLSPRGLTLAGSTAALLLVAGLALVRFRDRGEGVAELREPSPVGSALRREASPAPEPLAAQSAPQADETAPAPAEPLTAAAPSQAARLRQVQPGEGGEPVPVRASTPPAPARDEATTSTLGRMKQKAAAPATGDMALQAAPAPQAGTPAPAPAAKRAADATSNESPAARSVAPAPAAEVERAPVARTEAAAGEALSSCGTVKDSRGQPVAGAQVLVVNDVTRTARTGPDGSFCLPRLEPGDVLSVMRVGYEPVRLTLGGTAPLAVVMEPVGTLGPEAGKALTAPGTPSASGPVSGWTTPRALTLTPAKPAAPAPDVYAAQSAEVRDAVAAAREAARVARRDRSAPALDAAAARWDAIAVLVAGAALHDARFQALSLRRGSLSAEPTPERLARLREGLRVFVAQAPRTLPEYATARQWQAELDPGTKSLFR